jgi:predicted nuclease with TOPRIM domain
MLSYIKENEKLKKEFFNMHTKLTKITQKLDSVEDEKRQLNESIKKKKKRMCCDFNLL